MLFAGVSPVICVPDAGCVWLEVMVVVVKLRMLFAPVLLSSVLALFTAPIGRPIEFGFLSFDASIAPSFLCEAPGRRVLSACEIREELRLSCYREEPVERKLCSFSSLQLLRPCWAVL
jgi:hypothetical protein